MADSYELFLRRSQRGSGLAAPAQGGPFQLGDFIWNENPSGGNPLGWVCNGSNPSTWRAITNIQDDSATTVSAAGTVGFNNSIIDIDTGGFNVTITQPTSLQTNAVIAIVNNTASPVTLVPSAGTLYAGSAVISANTSAQVKANATNMYRIA